MRADRLSSNPMKALFIVILATIILLAGCGNSESGTAAPTNAAEKMAAPKTSENSLVGKWESPTQNGQPIVFEFKADGTMTRTSSGPDDKDPKYTDSLIQEGTYTVEGEKYSQQTT